MTSYYGSGINDLDSLRQEVLSLKQDNFDCYVDSNSLKFSDGRVFVPKLTLDNGKVFEPDAEFEYWMTPNNRANSQLRSTYGMPDIRWLEKQPQDLIDYVFNRRVGLTDAKRLMLRGYKDNYRTDEGGNSDYDYNIRGQLSDKYTRIDNLDVVDMLAKAQQTAGMHNTFVANLRMDRDFMSFWFLCKDFEVGQDPRGSRNGGNGTPLYPAAKITNGEVGNSSVWFQGGTFTGWCSNGMAFGTRTEESVSFRHRSKLRAEVLAVMAAEIAHCFAFSIPVAEAYVASYGEIIVGSALKDLVGEWSTKYGLSEEVQNTWYLQTRQEAINRGAQDITWGDLINGITQQVHTLDDDAGAEAIAVETYEGIGGDLLRSLFQLPTYDQFKAERIAQLETSRLL